MKIIKVMETRYDLSCLYKAAADTKARRGLFGYMLQTGRTDNTVLGGAFALLCDIENVKRRGELYKLRYECGPTSAKEMVSICEVALAGGFDSFAMSASDIRRTSKKIQQIGIA